MLDPYRTPATQKEFAEKFGQNPAIVSSFADGTKLSMEAAILANATGFRVGRRGMYGPKCAHVKEMASRLPLEQVLDGGLVDYALGAEPGTGAFVLVYEASPAKQSTLAYLKMGDGPLYTFYTPYHLPHLQIISTIARAALAGDATTAPIGGPVCEVIAVAKRDLGAGETLDGVGGFAAYGVIENAPVVAREGLLPMGLSSGCTVRRAIRKDDPIARADVELPPGRLCDTLRAEQDRLFGGEA
jgi:predicted homoserine dehydrogenase-like protein